MFCIFLAAGTWAPFALSAGLGGLPYPPTRAAEPPVILPSSLCPACRPVRTA